MSAEGWFLLASIVLFSFGHWIGGAFCATVVLFCVADRFGK